MFSNASFNKAIVLFPFSCFIVKKSLVFFRYFYKFLTKYDVRTSNSISFYVLTFTLKN